MSQPNVTIIGAGYVGLPTAALLANCGYKVNLLEIDDKRLSAIKQGNSFFYEAGLNELIKSAYKSGNFIATSSYDEAIPGSDIVFSCVGTPDNQDGSSNLSYVFDAATSAAKLMRPKTIFVQKSTVPVGTGQKIEQVFDKLGKQINYVSNPEFLREGSAIADSLWADRIVAGCDNSTAGQVISLYKSIEQSQNRLAKLAGVSAPSHPQPTNYITTARNSAELIKVSANAFLALKISFANSIAKLADLASADVNEVMDGIGSDKRIGRAFLNAGRGYGGGCFPKDVSGLMRSAEEYGVDMEIMSAATKVNNSMPHYIINKAENRLGGSWTGKKICVLGLAFKAGTSDVRRSPAIIIANTLAQKGASVSAYDPEAMPEAASKLDPKIKLATSSTEALAAASYVFIATDWPEFKTIKPKQLSQVKLIVDCMNCLDKKLVPPSVDYLSVGRTRLA
ncbi:MAG: UDP-glucose dehydrogenase family protein [Candidatus Saccharimonadales bacterium]